MRCLLALIPFFLVLPSWAGAQGPVQIFEGDRVRVTAPECQLQKQTATFLSVENGILSATVGENEIQCPAGSLTRLEVSLGDREWYKDSVRGMRYGALLGLVAGVTILARADLDDELSSVDALLAAAGLSATGFLVGTGIGALRDPEDWLEAPLPLTRPSVSVAGKGRFRFGFSILLRD